ncbi:DUF4012 domain-containing protein [Jatrophihabitans sp.]|uniref:DUF4012 domain-containing protein n=1 Tax=Jatrophihabitans sp. TaxID=1932789 RepID=UPI0030C6DAA3
MRRSLFGLAGLAVLGLGWLIVTGLLAVQAAHHAERDLSIARTMLSEGDTSGLQSITADLAKQTHRAHSLTTGPVWWVGSALPYVGRPVRVARGIAASGDIVGRRIVPAISSLSHELDPKTLHPTGTTIEIAPIEAARPTLDTAYADAVDALATIQALPRHTWLSSVDNVRGSSADELSQVTSYLRTADRLAHILPAMAGSAAPQRYFVGLQNEAELRGTGGVPGVFAILVAERGTIRFTHFESDSALHGGTVPTGLNLGTDFTAYASGSNPTSVFVNSDLSPNFPYAARIWAAMWQKVSGEHVDGAIALDPTALSYLLAVTGPATLPDGSQVSSANVVALTEKDEYATFADTAKRKAYLVELTKAVDGQLLSGAGSPTDLAKAFGRAGGENRLQVWSADAAVERVLVSSGFAGAIPQTARPFSALVVNNVAAGKLDYYLHRHISVQRTGCGATREVQVTIQLDNDAPTGLPAYVTTRLDSEAATAKPGDNRSRVDYVATRGAQLLGATVDGRPALVQTLRLLGHPVYRYDLELPRGESRTIVLRLIEPGGQLPPQKWTQPGVSALDSTYYDQRCG